VRKPSFDESNLLTDFSPLTIRNAFFSTDALVANAEPLARLHIEQWHITAGPSTPSIS
jgi:hypothetical protein